MKYIVTLVFAFLAIVFTDAGGVEEKEEILLKDKSNLVVRSEPQIERELREAHLKSIGFTKSHRTTMEVANGQRKKRKFIKYSVRNLRTKEKYWRRKMAKRLPKYFFSRSLNKDDDKEATKNASGVEEKEDILLKDKSNPVVRSEPQVERELSEAYLERIGFTKSRRTTMEVVNGQRKRRNSSNTLYSIYAQKKNTGFVRWKNASQNIFSLVPSTEKPTRKQRMLSPLFAEILRFWN